MQRPSRTGSLVGGKYELGQSLGQGAMGEVYEARHRGIGRRVAIKFLLPGAAADPGLVARFTNEGRAAGILNHENIMAVYDAGDLDDGTPYIVMEYLQGQSLDRLIAQEGMLPVPRAIDIVCQVCRGLEVAHASGIVHRDLKPANLQVTQRADGSDWLKILDFGIVKLQSGPSHTAFGQMIGTPLYMSPEQAQGRADVDQRSDIYALGVILYELLSGRTPLEFRYDDTLFQVISRIMQEEPPALDSLRADLPPGLCHLVHRAIAKDPAQRFAKVGEFAALLAPFARATSHGFAAAAWQPPSPAAQTAPHGFQPRASQRVPADATAAAHDRGPAAYTAPAYTVPPSADRSETPYPHHEATLGAPPAAAGRARSPHERLPHERLPHERLPHERLPHEVTESRPGFASSEQRRRTAWGEAAMVEPVVQALPPTATQVAPLGQQTTRGGGSFARNGLLALGAGVVLLGLVAGYFEYKEPGDAPVVNTTISALNQTQPAPQPVAPGGAPPPAPQQAQVPPSGADLPPLQQGKAEPPQAADEDQPGEPEQREQAEQAEQREHAEQREQAEHAEQREQAEQEVPADTSSGAKAELPADVASGKRARKQGHAKSKSGRIGVVIGSEEELPSAPPAPPPRLVPGPRPSPGSEPRTAYYGAPQIGGPSSYGHGTLGTGCERSSCPFEYQACTRSRQCTDLLACERSCGGGVSCRSSCEGSSNSGASLLNAWRRCSLDHCGAGPR